MNFILTGIGAGLVSALLTAVVIKATPLAAVLYLLAPIPVLIVSLGWNHRAGLVAAAVGGLAIAMFISPLSGVGFVVVTALPAWWLSYLALLGRPGKDGTIEWYPVGRLLAWIAGTATVTIVSAGIISTGGDYATFHQNARSVSQAFVNLQFPQGGAGGIDAETREGVVDWIARATPFLSAQGFTLVLTVYLYTAGKIVSISKRLPRSWPDISQLRMPRATVGLLVAGGVLAFLMTTSFIGVLGIALAGALLTAFALQGLAIIHNRSRGRAFRPMILTGVYVLLFLTQGILMIALSLFGLADTLFGFRRSTGAGPTLPQPPLSA
ncbi:DUF2232 domain-containing protein [Microvirga antarctica]|uniref:DUF2232 domain-containing protein n=1 Tax=Microvirga antarctica TaxID=2819233 RepID=UPI001B30EFD4|nr:DUF2232 domain-containing protein [Microvirga antarctica]